MLAGTTVAHSLISPRTLSWNSSTRLLWLRTRICAVALPPGSTVS